jgi:hypothetical protein
MRYMCLTFFRKPGGQIDEQLVVRKALKKSDINTCNVILDFGTKKVEKCIIEGNKVERTFDDLANYYRKVYPSLVTQLERDAPITLKAQDKKK